MQYAVLDADSRSAPGEVVSHRVLTSGQAEQTGAVDVPFHLDDGAYADRARAYRPKWQPEPLRWLASTPAR